MTANALNKSRICINISHRAKRVIEALSQKWGISASAVIELSVREKHEHDIGPFQDCELTEDDKTTPGLPYERSD